MKKIKFKRFQINMSNKWFYTFVAIGIVVLLAFIVYALAPLIDTSQGYHESNQVSVSVSGTEKTLQEAIDDGSFGGGADTNANTLCTGTDVYLDGDGNCDTASTIVANGGGLTGAHTICSWTGWSSCTASGTSTSVICPVGTFAAGYQRQGCSVVCADPTRCERVRLYCCN